MRGAENGLAHCHRRVCHAGSGWGIVLGPGGSISGRGDPPGRGSCPGWGTPPGSGSGSGCGSGCGSGPGSGCGGGSVGGKVGPGGAGDAAGTVRMVALPPRAPQGASSATDAHAWITLLPPSIALHQHTRCSAAARSLRSQAEWTTPPYRAVPRASSACVCTPAKTCALGRDRYVASRMDPDARGSSPPHGQRRPWVPSRQQGCGAGGSTLGASPCGGSHRC